MACNGSVSRLVRLVAVTLALLVSQLLAGPLASAETLRVGRAVPEAFSFTPIDIGMKTGIFKKHGLDIQSSAFQGDAKMQQGMAADSIDIAFGSGPAMAFIEKGAPIKAVAAMAGPPLLLALMVRPDSPVKTVADLKGKKVSVSTAGSLTYWLVSELSRQQGWGPKGIVHVPLGSAKPQFAALKTKEIDGMVTDLSFAFNAEQNGEGRILFKFGEMVKDFHIHVIFATNKLIAGRPDAIRAFLRGWFETIAFMRKNKAESVQISREIMGVDEKIASRSYDEIMPMFSDDGRFNPKALAVLSRSYVELEILPKEPDMAKLYTEAFLPKK